MKRIEKDNDTLANLTGQSLRLEPTRLRRTHQATNFNHVRTQAISLYNVLETNWCCSCEVPHNAILRLEARTSGTRKPSNAELKKLRFNMVFSFDVSEAGAHSLPWKSKETEIEPLEDDNEDEIISNAASSLHLPSLSPSSSTTLSASPSSQKKGVKWASDSQYSSTTTLAVRSPSTRSSSPTIPRIHDLCSAFRDYSGTEKCLGFLSDEKSMRHDIYPIMQPGLQNIPTPVTLYNRLSASRQSRKAKLTRRERLKLALTLAASVLQLHKTPWLHERWGKKDILFLDGASGPFVSRSFLRANIETSQKAIPSSNSISIIRNETIFALGVTLIELCLCQTLEDMRDEEDLADDGLPNSLTDYMTARRLVNEVYDEGGRRYGDAVRRCINCEFDQRNASLDVEAFRLSFYQGVVQPLEDDWVDFSSTNVVRQSVIN